MPVQTAVFEKTEVFFAPGRTAIKRSPVELDRRHRQENDTDQNMQTVQPCHYEIETKEDRLAMTRLQQMFGIRIQTVFDLRSPFEILVHHESSTAQDGDPNQK